MARRDKDFLFNTRVFEREAEIKTRAKLFSHLSASVLGIMFVFSLGQFDLDSLKGALVDVLFRTQWWEQPHPDIKIVAFDDDSARRYDVGTKFPAEELAQILDTLAEDQPRVVGIITPVNERLYSDAELSLIGKGMAKIPNAYIGYTDDESLGKRAPAALGTDHYLPGYISRDSFSYGADSVSRRVMVTVEGLHSLYCKMACLFRGHECDAYPHTRVYGKSHQALQSFINWQGRAGSYASIPSAEVSQRKTPKGTFTGKIVLVGTALSSRPETDFILTPYSRTPGKTTALEGAAQGVATLLRENGLSRSPDLVNWMLSLIVGILTVNLVLYLSPGRGILFVLGEIVVLFVVGWVSLFMMDAWVDLAHPLAVACVGYYLVIPYRLVDEYRKRWHYQEKSELMVQLEQLKSNFLSLISHDLKTPIARIQGNAELALSDPRATDKQRQYLDAIVHTTEDLSQYVETVLDLTRIESAQIPIQKSSKDVNAIISEVIESKRFMATDKNIELRTDLEPLFSIKFDVKLIRRVLSNLVENAIKYSPPDSIITMSSREEGNWIRIAVADQGVGISPEEQPKIFGKFYRVENPLTKNVKGTGLGLYLVKYFVELHQGMVELRSELGKGSTFTVSLPV